MTVKLDRYVPLHNFHVPSHACFMPAVVSVPGSCRLVPLGERGTAVSCILSRDMQDRQLSWIALAQAKIRSQTPFLSGQRFRTTWAPPLMVDLVAGRAVGSAICTVAAA